MAKVAAIPKSLGLSSFAICNNDAAQEGTSLRQPLVKTQGQSTREEASADRHNGCTLRRLDGKAKRRQSCVAVKFVRACDGIKWVT